MSEKRLGSYKSPDSESVFSEDPDSSNEDPGTIVKPVLSTRTAEDYLQKGKKPRSEALKYSMYVLPF